MSAPVDRRRKSLMVGGGVALLVLVVAVVAFVSWQRRERVGGPVDVVAQDRVSSRFRPGQAGSIGWITLLNAGKEPAQLESVRPVGVDPGLVIERVYVAGQDRRPPGYSSTEAWPVPPGSDLGLQAGRLLDPSRATIVPDAQVPDGQPVGVTLVIVLRADQPGDYAFRGVAVRYRVGGRRYRRVVTNAFTMCVSERATRSCTPKPGFDAEQAAKL